MPLTIACDEGGTASLEELVDHLFAERIQPMDQDALASAAPMLRRLANDRGFLARRICAELEDYRNLQSSNGYSAQVFVLYGPQRRGQSFFLRACFWPANADQVVKASGLDPFFYHRPHDHNFNFLTVGYHGPGYGSDYYEYDYDDAVGVRGETVPLRFVERSALARGKVLLYRAFTDVHDQLPAESFSVSLNIMENSIRASMMDQYAFDLSTGRISGLINRTSAVALFNAAAALGDDELSDVLSTIATSHPMDRVRLAALDALALSAHSREAALDHWALVKADDPQFLRDWRRVRTADIESAARTQA